jgi:uncharacterized protein YndB with AHSA1/START domain
MTETTLAPVRRSITVACAPERAFELFTERMGDWWPLRTHSLSGEQASTVVVEANAGGRLYEVDSDGGEHPWGSVLVWEPPSRFAVEWSLGSDTATEWEVTFNPDGDGTRLDLVHRHWERLGADAPATRDSYDNGWVSVLDAYVAEANT